MPFFDFHIHPTLKTLFSHNDPANGFSKISPYKKIKVPALLEFCSEFDQIMNSQSNLEQLFSNDVKMFGFPLFIPDTYLMNNSTVNGGFLANLFLKSFIHPPQLDKLIHQSPFQNLLTDDLPTLLNSAQFGMGHRTVKSLSRKSDFKENKPNQIHVFFTIEGLHTLCDQPDVYDVNAMKRNLDTLLNSYNILSATLTHLQRSEICNQAYAIQFLKEEAFYPNGRRIAPKGLIMMDYLRSKNILFDIKHMSLGARKHLYDIYNTQNWSEPVICTHAGLTGISWSEISRYIGRRPWVRLSQNRVRLKYGKPMKYGGNLKPAFNPVSLNLYDEDVLFILKSGGLIGLSLDKRILGHTRYDSSDLREDFPNNHEFISHSEREEFYQDGQSVGQAIAAGETQSWEQIQDGGEVDPMLSEFHLLYFMQQIAHIIVIARKNNYSVTKALKQICLGSDFDGIINPIYTCDSIDELNYFKIQFRNHFVRFCQDSQVNLPGNFSINKFTENLFYENGKAFVLNRLPEVT